MGFLRKPDRKLGSRRRKVMASAAGAAVFETLALWLRSGRLGGNIVVRCRQGHLFTTIWIPAASFKAARLGFWRIQYCPVGRHWTLVSPVKEEYLSEEELRAAAEVHDIRIP